MYPLIWQQSMKAESRLVPRPLRTELLFRNGIGCSFEDTWRRTVFVQYLQRKERRRNIATSLQSSLPAYCAFYRQLSSKLPNPCLETDNKQYSHWGTRHGSVRPGSARYFVNHHRLQHRDLPTAGLHQSRGIQDGNAADGASPIFLWVSLKPDVRRKNNTDDGSF